MAGHGRNLFSVIGIHVVYLIIGMIEQFTTYKAGILSQLSDALTQLGIVRNDFGYNIARSGNCVFFGFHTLFLIDILCSFALNIYGFLLKNYFAKRLQSFFLSHGSSCLFLLLKRAINIFDFGQRFRQSKHNGYFIRHLILRSNAVRNFLLSSFQIFEVIKSI